MSRTAASDRCCFSSLHLVDGFYFGVPNVRCIDKIGDALSRYFDLVEVTLLLFRLFYFYPNKFGVMNL